MASYKRGAVKFAEAAAFEPVVLVAEARLERRIGSPSRIAAGQAEKSVDFDRAVFAEAGEETAGDEERIASQFTSWLYPKAAAVEVAREGSRLTVPF